MYTDKITQSVAEAVKQVLTTEKLHPNQQKLDVHQPEKDELTSKDFEMLRRGKKAEVKEGWQDMLDDVKKRAAPQPNGGAGMKQGSRYGGSKQKDEPEDKKPMKEDMDINAINGVQMSTIDEAKFNPLKHIKNPSPAVKAAAPDVKRSSYGDRAALMKAGGVKDDRGPRGVTQEEVEQIEEKHLTEPETNKKEEVVKSMKKGLAGFKARYGDRAKSVMYATATKIAKDKA
jgi:hypothetical protein